MSERARKRDINGVVLLDKPIGLSSNQALQQVKQLFRARKAGHTGSLDPLASGLLPICFGEATKISTFLLGADKRYDVRCLMGKKTATADADGDVTEEKDFAHVTEQQLEAALESFRGPIEQVPPMYSAVKHKGERLYALARRGVEVEREPRPVHIYELTLTAFEPPEFTLAVRCSKGTYVRTLVEDIAESVDTVAHVIALRRTGVGPFSEDGMLALEKLESLGAGGEAAPLDAVLLPIDSAIADWPSVRLNADSAHYLKQGQPVQVPRAPTEGHVRIYSSDARFVGVGEVLADGRIAPRRLVRN